MEIDLSKLLALPAAERLELAEMLWQSVGYASTNEAPLSRAEQADLDERLDEYEAGGEPAEGRPVDEVLSDLRRKTWPGR
jgi:putative addiction module component (TIGR02574 family)